MNFQFRSLPPTCHNVRIRVIKRKHDRFRWQLADDFAPLLEPVLNAPVQIVKESPAKLVARHEINGRSYYVKCYRHAAFPFRPVKFFFKRSQAKEEWQLAVECEKRRMPIVRHVASGERWTLFGLQESILITEAFAGVPANEAPASTHKGIILFVERMARAGVMHLDLHPANLLVRKEPFEIRLVDLHGIHFAHTSAFESDANRDHMLAQLCISLSLKVPRQVEWFGRMLRQRALKKRSVRCLRTNREFSIRRFGRWKWNVRTAVLNAQIERVLSNPDRFIESGRALKRGRSSTVVAGNGLVLKRYNFKKPLNLLKDLFRGSRGRRGFRKAYHLELCGVPTARVIATADARVLGFPTRSYVLMEEISPGLHAGVWQGDERAGARKLGRLIASLHNEGFVHRDLKETNILFDKKGDPNLIDLDGLVFTGAAGPVLEEDAVSNLRRLAEGLAPRLTRSTFIGFLLSYCRQRRLNPRDLFPRSNHARRSR